MTISYHLYIFFTVKWADTADQISTASPGIATQLSRLTVHSHLQASYKILSSFTNVGQYTINCNIKIGRLQPFVAFPTAHNCMLTWHLYLAGNQIPYYHLRDFTNLKLTIHQTGTPGGGWEADGLGPIHGAQIHMDKLKEAVGPSLVSLVVIGRGRRPSVYRGDWRYSVIDPKQIAICLQFPKLEKIWFKGICRSEYDEFLAEVKSLRPFAAWPESLKEIHFLFGGEDDDRRAWLGQEGLTLNKRDISVKNCDIGVKVRHHLDRSSDRGVQTES